MAIKGNEFCYLEYKGYQISSYISSYTHSGDIKKYIIVRKNDNHEVGTGIKSIKNAMKVIDEISEFI